MKRIALGVASVAAASALMISVAGPAAAEIGGQVSWRNAQTGRYLSYVGDRKVVTKTAYDHWFENKKSDGSWELPWAGSAIFEDRPCLDSDANGNVYGIPCNGGDYQRWYEVKTSTGWKLQNKATGRILDSDANGNVYTLPDNGSNWQRWN